ncbi:MAG: hypothetical protein NTZ25_00515 [Candidatus Peregrinibacteria bacterium]|nr:hypothetical protein [Candidatus Peregrinibacteria bacterium]
MNRLVLSEESIHGKELLGVQKKPLALRIIESAEIRLGVSTTNEHISTVIKDSEEAIDNVYDHSDRDRHIVMGIILNLAGSARKALLDPEVN